MQRMIRLRGEWDSLVHREKENFETYAEARKRENFLKSGVGRKWIYSHFRDTT